MKFLQNLKNSIKYKYSPLIPDIDYKNAESRRKWILFMARKTGRLPVKEVYDKMLSHITKMTINNDLQYLEGQKLIRREKDKGKHSFIIPLFQDPEHIPPPIEIRRQLILGIGLPTLSGILLIILIAVLINS
jgi:hypothetical protein